MEAKTIHSQLPTPGLVRETVPFVCLGLIVAVTLVFIVTSAIVRPAMFSDSAWGFLNWDTGAPTAPFTHSEAPDPTDISKDAASFRTVWTPGQHVLPGLLEKAGLPLGLAITIVTAVFSVLGLFGWYALYRDFGFPARAALIALTIAACSRFFNLPFAIYNGGEVLLFGVAPWFLILVWRLRDLRWSALAPILAGSMVLFLAKLSGIVVAAAALCAAAVCGEQAWRRPETVRKLAVAGVAMGAIGAVFHFAWYVRGPTAASISVPVHPGGLPFFVAFALSSIWSASLSLGDLGNYVFLSPRRPLLSSIEPIYYALLPIALTILGITCWHLRRSHAEYLRFTLVMVAATSAFMILTWLRGASVSFEERHLRIVSLMLLVGSVHVFLSIPSAPLRALFWTFAVVASVYGLASFAVRTKANLERPMSIRGFRATIATADLLTYIRRIDVPGPAGERPLIYVSAPDIALDVRHARIISDHVDFETVDELNKFVRHGRVPSLHVLIESRLVAGGKVDAVLKSFVDYPIDGWEAVPLGDFTAYHQAFPR